MCVFVGAGALAANVALGVGAATTAASVGMGIYSANAQASQAAASMNMQQRQSQANISMQNRQAQQQLNQSQQQMRLQQQQAATQQQQQLQQQFQNQSLQQQQLAMQMEQNQDIAFRNQQLQVQQQQSQQRLQQEQAAEARNLQIQQLNNSLLDKYSQQKAAVRRERDMLMLQNQTDRRVYQDEVETSERQKRANNDAANRVYISEQNNLSEKRKEAAFQAQTILAKSIGAKGSILAAGRTGQSVGLLVLDTERQAGVETAQQKAMLKADYDSALISMDNAFEQNLAGNRESDAQVGFNPEMPYLPSMPEVPNFVGFEIPT